MRGDGGPGPSARPGDYLLLALLFVLAGIILAWYWSWA